MAGPQTPRELADRMRDHRAQRRPPNGEGMPRSLPEASTVQLPHAKLHRVLTREDDHGNLCRAYEVHRPRNPQR